MKKLILSLFLIGSLMLTSCSGNSPKTVAEKFMTAVMLTILKKLASTAMRKPLSCSLLSTK